MTTTAHGKVVGRHRLPESLWPVASVALRSAMEIGVALLLILGLLPAALGAIGGAAP